MADSERFVMNSSWADIEPCLARRITSRLCSHLARADELGPVAVAAARLCCKAWFAKVSSAITQLEPAARWEPTVRQSKIHHLRLSGLRTRFPALQSLCVSLRPEACPADDLEMVVEELWALENLRALKLELYRYDAIPLGFLGRLVALGDRLVDLSLRSSRITDADVAHLSTLQCLTSLSLRCSREMQSRYEGLSDESLQTLSSLVSLKSLDLEGNVRLTDAGLQHLSSLTNLSCLRLVRCEGLTASGLTTLQPLRRSLRTLDLKDVGLEGTPNILFLTGLTDLNLSVTLFYPNENVSGLMFLPHLKKLAVDPASPGAFFELPQLTELEDLRCISTRRMHDSDFDDIAKCLSLTSLTLHANHSVISDEGLSKLSTLTSLRSLSLFQTSEHITSHGVAAICPATIQSLEVDASTWPAQALFELLQPLTSLTRLTLLTDRPAEEDMALIISAITPGLEVLTLLDESLTEMGGYFFEEEVIPDFPFSEAGLRPIAKLTNLRQLHVQHPMMTDEALNAICGLSGLRRLNFDGCTKLTEKCLDMIQKLTSLKNIVLNSEMPQEAIHGLSHHLPMLTSCVNLGLSGRQTDVASSCTRQQRRASKDFEGYHDMEAILLRDEDWLGVTVTESVAIAVIERHPDQLWI